MAIDKRTFKQGMNKDIDQRLIPDDQYIEGINIKNLHGADGTMGVITPLKGNVKKGDTFEFAQGELSGGFTELQFTHMQTRWSYFQSTDNTISGYGPKKWEFELDFNLTGPDGATYNPSSVPCLTNEMTWNNTITLLTTGGSIISDFDGDVWAGPTAFLESCTAAWILGEKIQNVIDAIPALAAHIQVSVSVATVKIQCLQPGWEIAPNFYLDNFTDPAVDPLYNVYEQCYNTGVWEEGYQTRIIAYNQESAEDSISYICVGTATDEVKKQVYWFAHQLTGNNPLDYILRYDETTNLIHIVYKEYQAQTSGHDFRVLRLDRRKKIHSADVIGSKFLTWTDGDNPPKKLNIQKSINGLAYRTSAGKRFLDNNSATWADSEFEGVSYGDDGDLTNKLTFVSDADLELAHGDIIYVEQDSGFIYHEYNGYFKVIDVNSGGDMVVVDAPFISSSVTHPGTIWKVIDAYESEKGIAYSYAVDPRTHYWPEAYSNIYKHVKEQYLNVHKRGPRDRASYTYLDDADKKKNDLYGHVWQFSYRYIYDDEEVSALAPISDINLPSHMALNAATGDSYDQSHHNKIRITIPHLNDGKERLQDSNTSSDTYGGPMRGRLHDDNKGIAERLYAWPTNIKAIEIYARQGNKSPFLLIDTISWYTALCTTPYEETGTPRPDEEIQEVIGGITVSTYYESVQESLVWDAVETMLWPFSDLKVYFYNDGIYPVLDNRNSDKLYDWVPHTAESQAVIDNSSMVYANVTDGFNVNCEINAGVRALYRDQNDETYPTQPTDEWLGWHEILDSYADHASGGGQDTTSFGDPNGVSNDTGIPLGASGGYTYPGSPSDSQFSLTNPCPGYGPGNALVTWAGSNSEWNNQSAWEGQFQRLRWILPIKMDKIDEDSNGFLPIGAAFSCSGNFRFGYRNGTGNNQDNRYAFAHQWENVTATVTNATTTKAQFCQMIIEEFKNLPNFFEPDYQNQSDAWNIANWWPCEVFGPGCFYAPVPEGPGGLPGDVMYIYFRGTGQQTHNWDTTTKPKLYLKHFGWTSNYGAIAPSTTGFKTGAHHDFGLVYGNNRNQTSFVMKSPNTRAYVKFPTENRAGFELNPDDQNDAKGIPVMRWEIAHAPPPWAEWFQWVYAGNTTVKDFLQFTCERVAKNTGESNDKKIYMNLNSFKGEEYSYKKTNNPVIDYVFGEGDRIRFIKNSTGLLDDYIDIPIQEAKVFQYMTEETDIDQALSNPIREFVEGYTTNVQTKKKLMSGYWISFEAPSNNGFTLGDVTNPIDGQGGYKNLLFEIYNPRKKVAESIYYYGYSNKIAIEKDVVTGDRYHASDGSGHDQSIAEGTNAHGFFTIGDVYLKGRRMVDCRESSNAVGYSSYTVEGYFANDFIKSDSYNKGRKHTFNQYAKEEHRNTTIYYSGPYLPSSNVNGLSEFNIIDLPFKEYSIGYGDIVRLIEQDSNLIVFQSNKVSKIMVQKAILLGATGDSNVALSDQILSVATPYGGDYGPSGAGESVIKYENKIYFVDPIRGVMCRLSRDGITVISKNGMQSYFLKYFRERKYAHFNENADLVWYTHSAGIDPENNEYIYFGEVKDAKSSPEWDESKNVTVGFYEDLNKYVSFYTYKPEAMACLGSNFYSWNDGYIYLHNQDTTKANFNKFYGATTSATSKLKVVFNGEVSMVKTYNNLSIEGTYPWTPGVVDTPEQTAAFKNAAGNLHAEGGAHYWVRKEGVYHMPIPPGLKTNATAKYYSDKIYSNYEGVCSVTYNNATTLTITELDADIKPGWPYKIIDGAATPTPVDATITNVVDTIVDGVVTARILTLSPALSGTFVADTQYFLMKALSPCLAFEGEKMKGVFAKIDFTFDPNLITFAQDDEKDIVELYAINTDMEYSPLSYKNN